MKMHFVSLFVFIPLVTIAQKPIDTRMLEKLFSEHPEQFEVMLKAPDNKQVQVLYTRIDRDENNRPAFQSFGYHLDPRQYFYPASTVKLPAVIFALEKINRLALPGLTRETTMLTDSAFAGQTRVTADTTSANKLPSVAHYAKKILLTSDNDAFNRLFEFVGRAEMNRRLAENGLTHSRILNRLAINDSGESARHTNPVTFYNRQQVVYRQEAQYDEKDYPLDLTNLLRGKGYLNAKEQLVMEPYSFADKNTYPLEDQQLILRKLLFPEAFPEKERFKLTDGDYQLIYRYMSMYPQESDFPKYDPKAFWSTYSKMIFLGRDKLTEPNPNIRIFNKFGDSYGYVIDNAYFVDLKNKVEFMVTAVIQSNNDEIYNDNSYEYETVCYPFMQNLGKVLYAMELKRKKTHAPDLKKFKLKY